MDISFIVSNFFNVQVPGSCPFTENEKQELVKESKKLLPSCPILVMSYYAFRPKAKASHIHEYEEKVTAPGSRRRTRSSTVRE